MKKVEVKIADVCREGVQLDYMLKGEGGFGRKALGMTVAGWGILEGMSSVEGA